MSDEDKIEVIFSDRPQQAEEPVTAPGEPVATGDSENTPAAGPAGSDRRRTSRPADPGPGYQVRDRRFWNLSEEELAQEEDGQPEVPTYVAELQRKLEERDRQLREYIAAYKKEVGEGLERTKERLTREAEQKQARAREQMLLPMLEVLDALDRSVTAAAQSDNFAALLDGVKMVQKLMVQRLEEVGLTRVPGVGAPFDPNLHEALAMAQVQDPAQDRTVVMEFKPGFMLGDRVVRPAQVQVGKLGN